MSQPRVLDRFGSCRCGRPLDRDGAESMSDSAAGLCPDCRAARRAALAAATRETTSLAPPVRKT